ncbi:MAG: hypothetical protein QM747_03635 [Nocardioides sp.]
MRPLRPRHASWRRRLGRLVLLVAGLLVLAPLVSVDPAVLALLLDVDLLVLLAGAGLTLLAVDLRTLARTHHARLSRSLPVLWMRVGFDLTRVSPRTLAP